MFDIRVVSAKVVLDVAQIAPFRGFLPPSIVILGHDLDKTTEILYNEQPVDEFFIQSPNRIIAKIPAPAVGKPFVGLQVLSTTFVSKKDALLSLKLNNPLQKLSGMDRLIQNWVMTFMTTPGSSVFNKSSGGGGRAIIGKSVDKEGHSATSALTLAIERTKNEIITRQTSARNIPADELLLTADLDAVSFDQYTGRLSATVNLQNMVGASSQVSLG